MTIYFYVENTDVKKKNKKKPAHISSAIALPWGQELNKKLNDHDLI